MKKAYLPVVLWLAFVTGLSVMPGIQLPKFELFAVDKLAHAIVYAVLVWLTLRCFLQISGAAHATKMQAAKAFAFAACYGALMEWVQGTFFPGRFFEFDDMIANGFGAGVAGIAFLLFKKRSSPSN